MTRQRTPAKATRQDPIAEWQQHNPFQRASPDLIRRVQSAQAGQRAEAERVEREGIEDAPF